MSVNNLVKVSLFELPFRVNKSQFLRVFFHHRDENVVDRIDDAHGWIAWIRPQVAEHHMGDLVLLKISKRAVRVRHARSSITADNTVNGKEFFSFSVNKTHRG